MPVDSDIEGMEDEGTIDFSKLNDPYVAGLLLIVALFALSLFYPYGPNEMIEIGNGTLLFGIFLLLFISTKPIIQWAKYHTGMLTADGLHGSTWGEPVVKGGIYEAYTLGDCRVGVMNFRGKEGTVIGPAHAFRRVGRNINSAAWVQKIKLRQIPMPIRDLVIQSKACRPPYYRLWYDSRLEGKIAKLDYLRSENLLLNEMTALQEKKIKRLMDIVESSEEWKRRVTAPILEAGQERRLNKLKSKLLGGD